MHVLRAFFIKQDKDIILLYNIYMILALVLISVAFLLYLIHGVFGVADLPYGNPVASLMGGFALVGMILSVACFFLQVAKLKIPTKKKEEKATYILWLILSIISFLAYVGFIVVILMDRANIVGIAW